MNVTIVGCGNVGTQIAVHCASKNHSVTIFTSKFKEVQKTLYIVDNQDNVFLSGEIKTATDNEELAFSTADIIFVTVPSFYMKKQAEIITPYLKKGAIICIVPGMGGGEFAFKQALENGAVICGLQRVPSVARLKEYGKTVCATGYRDKLFAGALPTSKKEECAKLLSGIFDMPCDALPHYLNLTLTPSNPILHTTRLKTIFKDYKEGVFYEKLPLFYQEWDLESSELLLKCDKEVQDICLALKDFDLSFVKSLKEHYESDDALALTNKITSIPAFFGLTTPCVKTENGLLPDFDSRYFTADFMFGLTILIQIAGFLNLPCPHMKQTFDWFVPFFKGGPVFDFKDYNVFCLNDLLKFYNA